MYKVIQLLVLGWFMVQPAALAETHGDRWNLPDLGTIAATTLTIDQELQIGELYMQVLNGQLPVVGDPVMNAYINDIGHQLVAHSTSVRTPFEFFLVNHNEINAFAFFGGHVGVHTALFLHTENESELASVLAHEIAHVTQRHLARSIEAQQKNTPTTLAGVLGSILLAMAAPEAGMAALQTTLALSTQGQINFTRANELEADRIGMQALARAGFDPWGAPNFFGKLANQYRYVSMPPPMLMTHPLPDSRIADTRARAEQLGQIKPDPSLQFQLAKTRVEVRYSNYGLERAEDLFLQRINRKQPLAEAHQYGLALIDYQREAYSKAQTRLLPLLENDSGNLFYLDALTDVYLAQNKFDKAINLLTRASQRQPNNAVIDLNLANSLLQAKQPLKAKTILERQLALNGGSAVVYDLLAQTYRAMNKPAQQHQVRAEQLALAAQFSHAISQLEQAYQLAKNDPLLLARIDARIAQLRQSELQLKQL